MTDLERHFRNAIVFVILFSSFSSGDAEARRVHQLSQREQRDLKSPSNYLCLPKHDLRTIIDRRRSDVFSRTKCKRLPRNSRRMQRSLKQLAQETEVKSGERAAEAPLVSFRIIGCTVVTVLVGLTLIIYVTSGMFYHDCLAQICCEACVLTAYTFILLTTTESLRLDAGLCLGIAILLHFLFLGAFLFSLIEVTCMCRLLLTYFPKNILGSSKSIMLWGWALPMTISGVSAVIWYDQYTTKRNCWMVIGNPPIWPTIVPIGMFVGLQVILLILVLIVSEVPADIAPEHYRRAKSCLNTRWASAILLPMLVVSWSCGLVAYQGVRETDYAAFTVASIVLGVCVFTLRISTDEEIRKIITANLLCFITSSRSNKITSYPHKMSHSKKGFVADLPVKNIADYGEFVNNGVATSHR